MAPLSNSIGPLEISPGVISSVSIYSKGPRNKDPYNVGDWILVSHGRWTRGIKLETEADGEIEMRKVELESVLAYSEEKPEGLQIGAEYADGEHATIDPSSFVNA